MLRRCDDVEKTNCPSETLRTDEMQSGSMMPGHGAHKRASMADAMRARRTSGQYRFLMRLHGPG
jgi:hypothetical protein